MPNIVGSIPEFTADESAEPGVEEVKQPVTDEVTEQTETAPELPAETEKPADGQKPGGDNTEQLEDPLKLEIERATKGLRDEIVDLRTKLAQANGNDRKLIKQDIIVAQDKIDELADVNPADVTLIEKVLKSKGYMTKQEAQLMTKSTVQTQTLNNFLNKYPEYKPENDPNDINWKILQKELSYYRDQEDPSKIAEILERAHKAIHPQAVSDRQLPQRKRAIEIASAGSGGVQRSSSQKTLDPKARQQYEAGGWSEEEINEIEKNLA